MTERPPSSSEFDSIHIDNNNDSLYASSHYTLPDRSSLFVPVVEQLSAFLQVFNQTAAPKVLVLYSNIGSRRERCLRHQTPYDPNCYLKTNPQHQQIPDR